VLRRQRFSARILPQVENTRSLDVLVAGIANIFCAKSAIIYRIVALKLKGLSEIQPIAVKNMTVIIVV